MVQESNTWVDIQYVVDEILIRLCIPAEEFVHHYRGVRRVHARAMDGRTVALPAGALRPFVTHSGVRGTFRFQVGDDGTLLTIERVN